MAQFPSLEVPVLTVSQVTSTIKQLLESRFHNLFLQGEISNFKRQASGHLYFSLKDDKAQISCVMFRANAHLLHPLPKEGDHVMVKGELSVYEPRGNYQLIIRELSYVGAGALLLKLEQLKQKLLKLGYFAPERKKPLPRHPKRIGVVTSPTGAVIQDILNVLSRRHSGFHLILNPVKVQGEAASFEIASAIRQFNQHKLVDVMIVGRGGGSIEDLFAFNEEIVAKAIYDSEIPVISAVGHETDFSISDMVADVRAPTPSAAAEIVIAEKSRHLEFLSNAKKRLLHTLNHLLKHNRLKLHSFSKHPLILTPYTFLGKYIQQLDDIRCDLQLTTQRALEQKRIYLNAIEKQVQNLNPKRQLEQMRSRLLQLQKNLDNIIIHRLQDQRQKLFKENFYILLKNRFKTHLELKKQRLNSLIQHLQSIDPNVLLKKGYSILFSEKDSSLIISTKDLHNEQFLTAHLSDGKARLIVKEVN